jgi:hypothetical protein
MHFDETLSGRGSLAKIGKFLHFHLFDFLVRVAAKSKTFLGM